MSRFLLDWVDKCNLRGYIVEYFSASNISMKTTKRIQLFLSTHFVSAMGIVLAIVLTGNCVEGKSISENQDSSSIYNFYNTSGSFIYRPDLNIRVNEHEMKAGLLYDIESKRVVWQKEMNTPYPIASLTKMMVALLTVEDVHAGKINWTDNIQWTREVIVRKNRRKTVVQEQMNYSLYDLFKAAMIASNNEAAEQISRYVTGDMQTFIDRMNTRARELSMNSTFYGNPTGLPASTKLYDNSSTPTDLLILTLEMLKYDEILRVTGMGYADINNGRSTSVIRNHNHLTIDYKGEVDGMKTGYTKRAGFCLAATSNKCDHRLISIVLGARSPNLRNEVVKDMLNDYYSSIGLDKLGPYCEAPNYVTAANSTTGDFVYRTRYEKKIYVVKRGEDLASVAYQNNCTVSDIKTWNKLRSGKLAPGKKLTIVSTINEKIPVTKDIEEDPESSEVLTLTEENSSQNIKVETAIVEKNVPTKTKKTHGPVQLNSKYIIYIVQPGDTLSSIARRYELANVAQLKAVNKITKGHVLKVGAKIKVPVNS